METSSFPKWALITLGIVAVAFIITLIYSNYKSKQNSHEAKGLLQSEPLKDELKAEVKQDISDILASAHLALNS